MQVVVNDWPELKKDCHPLLVEYWTYREEISAENGLLFKGHRLIVPEKLRRGVLQTIHEGHFGFEKMQLRAREAVFWPGITSDLIQYFFTRPVKAVQPDVVFYSIGKRSLSLIEDLKDNTGLFLFVR